MKILTLLCVFVLQALAEDILSRVERATAIRCPSINIENGNGRYRRNRTRVNFKCNKGYTLHGSKKLNCRSDGTLSGQLPVCVRNGCTSIDLSHIENLDATEGFDGALLRFTCEEGYKLVGLNEIYCDGKEWSTAPPTCLAPSKMTECYFEKDLCGWTQDIDDQRNWDRNMGPTQTGNTGPKYDHTYMEKKAGHYLYFESSKPTMDGDKARLRSPLYPKDLSQRCFVFWYHMLGPEEKGYVGSLEVFIVGQSEKLADKQPMFYKEGNQGDEWHEGDIYIDTMTESFQIVIVATRKVSYISDIAIDDLRLYDCKATADTTSTPSTITESTIPDTSPTEPVKKLSTASTANASIVVMSSTIAMTTLVPTPEKTVTNISSTSQSSSKYTTLQNATNTSEVPTIYYNKTAVKQTVTVNITGHSETQAAMSTKSPTTSSITQSSQDVVGTNTSLPSSTYAATSSKITSITSINMTGTVPVVMTSTNAGTAKTTANTNTTKTIDTSGPSASTNTTKTIVTSGLSASTNTTKTIVTSGPSASTNTTKTIVTSGPSASTNTTKTIVTSGPSASTNTTKTIVTSGPSASTNTTKTIITSGPSASTNTTKTIVTSGPSASTNTTKTIVTSGPSASTNTTKTIITSGPSASTNTTKTIVTSGPSAIPKNVTITKEPISSQQVTSMSSEGTSKRPSSSPFTNTSITNVRSPSSTTQVPVKQTTAKTTLSIKSTLPSTKTTLSTTTSLPSTGLKTTTIVNNITTPISPTTTAIKSSVNVFTTQIKSSDKETTTNVKGPVKITTFAIKTSIVTETTSRLKPSAVTTAKNTSISSATVSIRNDAKFSVKTTKPEGKPVTVTEGTKYNSSTAKTVTTSIQSSSSHISESSSDGRFTTELTTATNSSTSVISVSVQTSRHAGDKATRPLIIGVIVGVVAGLIIIVVVALVCFRRKRLYVSRYEDELKPIAHSASTQSLNDTPYYQDEYESES